LIAVKNRTVTNGKLVVMGDSDETRGNSCIKHIILPTIKRYTEIHAARTAKQK